MSVYYGPRNGKRRARRRRHRRARSVSHFWEFFDPSGSRHGGLPTYPWGMAPEGLATKRQLLALELRPGGQPIAAQIMWIRRGKPVFAYLYRVDRAKPKRIPTLAQLHVIEKALQARRTCPVCGLDAGYTIPTSLGCCVDCYNRLKGEAV